MFTYLDDDAHELGLKQLQFITQVSILLLALLLDSDIALLLSLSFRLRTRPTFC